MRATQSIIYRSLYSNLNTVTERLNDLRLQGATGKKVNRPSDAPASIRPILNARSQIRNSERYLESMGTAMNRLETTDATLDQVENLMVRAKEVALSSINGSLSKQDRETLADQVTQLRDEMFDLANSKIDGKYIFSGYSENVRPFEADTSTDPSIATYLGDANTIQFDVGPEQRVGINLTGNNLFLGDADNDGAVDPGSYDIFNLLADVELALRQDIPPTGIMAVDESKTPLSDGVTGERIVAMPLEAPEEFPPASGEFIVADFMTQNGDRYVVIEDGAGAKRWEMPPGTAFNDGGGNPVGLAYGMDGLLDPLDAAADQVRSQRSYLGNVASRVESAMNHMEEIRDDMKEILGYHEDADVIETMTKLVQEEIGFEGALNITAKVGKLSILDYV